MADNLKSFGAVFAEFEEAIAAARDERDKLAADIVGLRAAKANLVAEIEAAQTRKAHWDQLTGIQVFQKCVAAGVDRFTLAELQQQIHGAA
jgi:hypothetical protein